jgi:hypothetical protein
MEWFYGIVEFLWNENNMYITIAIVAFIIGVLHSMGQGG